MGSIEVPLDREDPGAHLSSFPSQPFIFSGRGWPSKSGNANKRHSRVQISRIGGATRPKIFILETRDFIKHTDQISERYNSPDTMKSGHEEQF